MMVGRRDFLEIAPLFITSELLLHNDLLLAMRDEFTRLK